MIFMNKIDVECLRSKIPSWISTVRVAHRGPQSRPIEAHNPDLVITQQILHNVLSAQSASVLKLCLESSTGTMNHLSGSYMCTKLLHHNIGESGTCHKMSSILWLQGIQGGISLDTEQQSFDRSQCRLHARSDVLQQVMSKHLHCSDYQHSCLSIIKAELRMGPHMSIMKDLAKRSVML